WLDDGFEVGEQIIIEGTSGPSNDGTYTIAGIDATARIITIAEHTLTTDGPLPNNVIVGKPGEHGHQSMSIMTSTANNALGVTGINWNSPLLVENPNKLVQTVGLGAPTGGKFTLTVSGPGIIQKNTDGIDYDASAEDVQAALQKIFNPITYYRVSVTGNDGG